MELRSALDKAAVTIGLSTSASALLAALSALPAPAPRTGLEALGRARFSGHPVDSLATTLDLATASACGAPFFDQTALEELGAMGPQLLSGTVSGTNQLYDLCDGHSVDLIRYLPPFKEFVECGSALWLVNLQDGTPELIPLASGVSLGADSSTGTVATLDHLAWLDAAVTPAKGLSPPVWTILLHVRNLDGSLVSDVPFPTPISEGQPAQSGNVRLYAMPSDGFLVMVESNDSAAPKTAYFLGGTGKVIDSLVYTETGNDDTAAPGIGPTYSVPFDSTQSQLFNSITAQQLTLPDPNKTDPLRIGDDGGCGLRAVGYLFVSSFGTGIVGPTLLLSASSNAVATTVVAPYNPDNNDGGGDIVGATSAGVLVTGPNSSVQLLAEKGGTYALAWSLPSSVVNSSSARISLGWVVVTNNSGDDVIVDPATGQEATGLDAATTVLIKDKTATVTHADADNLVIETADGLVHLSAAAVCG